MFSAHQRALIEHLDLSTRRLVDEALSGHYRSVFKGRGLDFEELRSYEPGDDLRTIDWNVTARLGAPYVRQYREERELNIILAVDISASTAFGSTGPAKRARAAELGAALAHAAAFHRDRVGLLLFSDEIELVVRPARGRDHVRRVIAALAEHPARSRGTSLRRALAFLHENQPRRSVIVLVSDFLADDAWDALRLVNERHDVVPVVLRDPHETALPDAGRLRLADPETGEVVELDTSAPAVRAAYAAARAREAEARTAAFRRCGCTGLELAGGEDLLAVLRTFLAHRARLRHG